MQSIPFERTSSPVARPLTPMDGSRASRLVRMETRVSSYTVTPDVEPEILQTEDEALQDCPFASHGCAYSQHRRSSVQKHIQHSLEEHTLLMGQQLKPLSDEIIAKTDETKQSVDRIDAYKLKCQSIFHLYSHQFVWKLENYSKHVKQAQTGKVDHVQSPEFFTHRNGYLLTLSLFPFGDGEATREHASIFVSILRSGFDGMLEWPFTCPVTFTLVSQAPESVPDKVVSLAPQASIENMVYLDRPKDEANPAFGLQKFVFISEMSSHSPYIKDDVVFITVDVDLSSLESIEDYRLTE